MSEVIEKFLLCDKCGEPYGIDNRQYTIAQHRVDAHKEGWITVGRLDYCANCRKAIIKQWGVKNE